MNSAPSRENQHKSKGPLLHPIPPDQSGNRYRAKKESWPAPQRVPRSQATTTRTIKSDGQRDQDLKKKKNRKWCDRAHGPSNIVL
jgi:hypothetical protein